MWREQTKFKLGNRLCTFLASPTPQKNSARILWRVRTIKKGHPLIYRRYFRLFCMNHRWEIGAACDCKMWQRSLYNLNSLYWKKIYIFSNSTRTHRTIHQNFCSWQVFFQNRLSSGGDRHRHHCIRSETPSLLRILPATWRASFAFGSGRRIPVESLWRKTPLQSNNNP